MSYSQEFLDFCTEQLSQAGEVSYKKMFGGVGFYLERCGAKGFIACLSSDQLFLKVDDATRPKYQDAGMLPFQPFADRPPKAGKPIKASKPSKPMERFYEVPADVLENREKLAKWAIEALGVAVEMEKSKGSKKPKQRPKKKS